VAQTRFPAEDLALLDQLAARLGISRSRERAHSRPRSDRASPPPSGTASPTQIGPRIATTVGHSLTDPATFAPAYHSSMLICATLMAVGALIALTAIPSSNPTRAEHSHESGSAGSATAHPPSDRGRSGVLGSPTPPLTGR